MKIGTESGLPVDETRLQKSPPGNDSLPPAQLITPESSGEHDIGALHPLLRQDRWSKANIARTAARPAALIKPRRFLYADSEVISEEAIRGTTKRRLMKLPRHCDVDYRSQPQFNVWFPEGLRLSSNSACLLSAAFHRQHYRAGHCINKEPCQ